MKLAMIVAALLLSGLSVGQTQQTDIPPGSTLYIAPVEINRRRQSTAEAIAKHLKDHVK